VPAFYKTTMYRRKAKMKNFGCQLCDAVFEDSKKGYAEYIIHWNMEHFDSLFYKK
jgi:hypothetical protein